MQSFRTGLAFFKQAWGNAQRKSDLLKPGLYSLLVGFILSLLALAPIGLVIIFLGSGIPGWLLIGLLCILLLAGQMACAELFSLMTIFLFYGHLAQGETDLKAARGALRRTWLDALILAAAGPGIALQRRLGHPSPLDAARPERAWLGAAYLVAPVMVIENLGLKASVRRTSQIVKDNLLRSSEHLLGVKAFNQLASILLGLAGFILGLLVGLALGGVIGAGAGIILASLFILAAINLAAFNRAAYHTCLYLWARRVEAVQQQSQAGEVLAPEMLTAAL